MIHWLTHKVNGALNKLPKEISRVEINKIGKIEIKGVPVFLYNVIKCILFYNVIKYTSFVKIIMKKGIDDLPLKQLTNKNLIIVIILDWNCARRKIVPSQTSENNGGQKHSPKKWHLGWLSSL